MAATVLTAIPEIRLTVCMRANSSEETIATKRSEWAASRSIFTARPRVASSSATPMQTPAAAIIATCPGVHCDHSIPPTWPTIAASTSTGAIHIQRLPPMGWGPKMSRSHPSQPANTSRPTAPSPIGSTRAKNMLVASAITLSGSISSPNRSPISWLTAR